MGEWDKSRWYVMSGLLDELLEADVATRATRLSQLRTEDHCWRTRLPSCFRSTRKRRWITS
jgi:hypothetical protein